MEKCFSEDNDCVLLITGHCMIRKDLSCGPQPNHCMTWIQVAHIKAEPSREPNSYLCLHEQDDLLCLMKTAKKIRNTAVTSYLCACTVNSIT